MPKPARLGAKERLTLIERVVKEGVSVVAACRAFGVSRFTFYKWYQRYLQAKPGEELKALSDRTPKGKRHWRRIPAKLERQTLSFIAQNPRFSVHKIAQHFPQIGHHGVQNILEKHNLNRIERRKEFSRLFPKRRVLTPEEKLSMIEVLEKEEESVAYICLRFSVSRFTFYKWYNRYKEARKGEEFLALASRRPKGERHWRTIKPAIQDKIISLVISYPEYSTHKVADLIPEVGNHGVQNVFARLNLNTYQKRLAYAEAQAPIVTPIVGLPASIERLIGKIPVISAIPPPARARIASAFPPFLFSLLSSVFLSTIFIYWLRMLSQAPTLGAKLGLFFASTSLLIGGFFFAYSMKYYLTLAIVLSFSRQPLEEGGGYAVGLNGSTSPEASRSNGNNWLARIFGVSEKPAVPREAQRSGGGLQPSLDHIKLKRYPFVSIHLPFYNEKKVAERILRACTSIDYPNYEVIVIDDSTDETTNIVQRYANKWNKGIANFNSRSSRNKLGYSRPRIKILHRPTRQGFKGGALAYALKHMNPKTEFVVVFDADFVPYPDTLELFLKYFQVNAGTLDFKGVANFNSRQKRRINSANPGGSNIAVVGGYQWHVLNKSENWITRGVRTEYAGSYVIERPGREILGLLKQISGSVYMIRADVLKKIGWETSITEDFQLTLKLYEQGYKIIYTPYVQAPAECVSTLKRLIRQRMRWAEGHSNNIRRMFWRLMVGRWEEEGVANFNSRSNRRRMNSANPGKKWVPSPLTLPEKLEVLYISPYYLQAAFFMVGTFCWLISETVFRARLPFWTSVWGWSLVLTNFFSLPLMNMVGMFLEEAEEKDYVGILSFIFLSYILVPFQAYASVKGFLEKEEGPWFRTPKTGRITDIFTRGRFYRWISGILPGRRPAPALARNELRYSEFSGLADFNLRSNRELKFANPYLSLATANNQFNQFLISRKRARWVGRTFLVILLIFSTLLLSIAPGAPYFIKPKETQAKTFGILAGPGDQRSITSPPVQVEEASPASSVREERQEVQSTSLKGKNFHQELGEKLQRLPSKLFRSFLRIKEKLTTLTKHGDKSKEPERKVVREKLPRRDFRLNEEPVLSFHFPRPEIKDFMGSILGRFRVRAADEEVKVIVLNYIGQEIEAKVETLQGNEGELKVKMPISSDFKPGAYTVKAELVRDETTYVQEQEFTWGVLAINTNKSIYLSSETAYIQMAALRDDGHTICDASLKLQITNPKSQTMILSTEDGTIQYSGKCGPNNVTDVPDYFAYFQVGEPGKYEMKLTNLDNGYEISDSFEARESVPFDIERIGPTRIYPPVAYEMTLKIKANQDFSGEVIEQVPDSFEINLKSQNSNLKTTTQNSKLIVWEVDWRAGENYELRYQFDAPDISPYFYLLGPLQIGDFQEARRWQIAADADVAIDSDTYTVDASQNNTSPQTVFINDQVGYSFFVDALANCAYRKTTDGGATWPTLVGSVDSVNTADCVSITVWYDRWTPGDTTGTYIHIGTFDTGVDDLYYTRLNTSDDTKSTTVLATTQAGSLAAGTNLMSITKGTDGALYMTTIDASDGWVVRCTTTCTTAGNWAEITNPSYTLTNDWPLLMPLAGGSIMLIRMELAGNDWDYKIWNGSSWSASWTTIDTTSGENATYDGHFGATLDKANNNIYFAYVTDNGTLGTDDDIRTAIYNGTSWDITTADVLTNDSKGITNAKIAFDQNTGDVYVVYSGPTTPATLTTANVYWKKSTNGMASWGAENQLNDTADDIYGGGNVNIMSDERIYATWKRVSLDDYYGDTVADLTPSSLNQAAYRWFENNNGTSVVNPLAAQDTATTAPAQGTGFRLRGLLDVSQADLGATSQSFTLQYAVKSGSCDSDFVGETYSDVSDTSGNIRFNNNSIPADGDTVTQNATYDPTYLGHTNVMERYEENNPTNNVNAIPNGQAGLWDFSLVDNSAPAGTSYCFRIKKSGTYTADATVVKDINVGGSLSSFNYGTWDGTYYWIGNYYDHTLKKINPAGTVVNTYTLASDINPLELAWDGTYIWVASADTYGKLVKFDPSTGQTVATYTKNPTGLGAGGIQGVLYDGTNLWIGVAQAGGGAGSGFVAKLSLADPDTNICTATGITDVNGLTHSGSYVWAAANTGGNFVAKILKSDCSKTTYATGTNPVRVDNDGTYLYVAHWNGGLTGKVYKLLMSDGSTAGIYDTCVAANTIRLDNAGNYWTACDDGNVKVHSSTGTTLDTLTPGAAGDNINGLVFDGNYMWVNNWQTSHVYKMNTGEMLNTYTVAPEIKTRLTISGNAYHDEGTTPIDGSVTNKTVNLRIGGSGTYTDEITTAGGAWEVTGLIVSSGDIITVYLDNEIEEATTVFISDGTAQTNVNLYKNRVVVRADTGSITNANLATGDDTDDDVKYNVATGNLTVDSGFELHIWSGDTLDPGGTVTTQGTGGDLHLDDNSTFTGGTTQDDTISGNVSIDTGATLTAPSTAEDGTISVAGNWTKTGTFTAGNGKVLFIGAGGTTQVISGDTSFYDLTASTTTARTLQFAATSTQSVTHSLIFGGATGQLLTLITSSSPTQWNINVTGTHSINYVHVGYSNATGNALEACLSTEVASSNTAWTIYAGSCPRDSTSPAATAQSFQRKTWYDGTRHWMAFYSGSAIEFWYSTDNGSTWIQNASAIISVSTNDFSIEADSLNAFVVYTAGIDIKARKASSYPGTGFSWGSATTVFQGGVSGWWDLNWIKRKQLTVSAATGNSVSAGYSVKFTATGADAADIYNDSLTSGNDFRILWWNSPSWVELDRDLVTFTSLNIEVWFKLQAGITGGLSDNNYYAYYSNSGAGAPPANKSNVYKFFDDFNRADSSSLGSNWTEYQDLNYSILSNEVDRPDATLNNEDKALATGLGSQTDIEIKSKVKVTAFSDLDERIGITVRAGDPTNNLGYAAVWHEEITQFQLLDTGIAWKSQTTKSDHALNEWWWLKLQVIGTTMKAKAWDITTTEPESWDITDTSTTQSSGTVGFFTSLQGVAAGKYDDFYARDIVATEPTTSAGTEEIPGGEYDYPTISKDSNNKLWITATNYDSPNYLFKAVQSTTANDISAWGTATTLDTSANSNKYGVIVPQSLGGNMYAVWIDGTTIEGKKYVAGTGWDAAATSIATGTTGLANNMSALTDTTNYYIHLLYINSTDYAVYQEYTTTWQTAVTLDGTAGCDYATISWDTATNDLYALWIRGNTIYYKKGVSPYGSGNWDASATSWKSTGTNTNVTSNYSGAGMIFAEWTSGTASPYSVNWDYVIIPERIWLFLGLGLIIPGLLRRKKRKRIANLEGG